MKTCHKCNLLKPTSDFFNYKISKDGFYYICKSCLKSGKTDKDRFGGDKEKARIYYSKKYQRNKEKVIARNKEYRNKNRKHLLDRQTEIIKIRKNSDKLFAMKLRVADLIRKAFKSKGLIKKSRTRTIIGCDSETLVIHIESKFHDGMTWDNRVKWHIDHVIPLASAKNEADLILLNHYTNLQPLWAIDNLKKGAKHNVERLESL